MLQRSNQGHVPVTETEIVLLTLGTAVLESNTVTVAGSVCAGELFTREIDTTLPTTGEMTATLLLLETAL